MLQKKILKDTALLNGAGVVGQGFAFLQSFFVLRFLEPSAYGIWAGLTIILIYSTYVHLGLEYGLGVRLPYHLGQDNVRRARQIEDSVYLVWMAASLVVAAGLLCYALLWDQPSDLIRLGLVVIAALIPLGQQVLFLSRWQTSVPVDFSLGSVLSAAQGLLSLVVIVPLAYWFGVSGVMIGTLVVAAVMCAAWTARTRFRLRWQFSRDALWEILRIGFPILLVVLGGVLIRTVDRLLIVAHLGAEQLGYYAVTGLGGAFLYSLLSQAGSAIAPHISREIGRAEDSAPALRKFLLKPTLIFACLAAGIIAALVFTVPPLVELLLPQYVPGLAAFYLFVPGFFFLGVILTANNILNVVLIGRRRQRLVVYIQLIAVVVEVVCGLALIRVGWGIAGVALGSTLAYASYGLPILYFASKYVIPEAATRIRFLGTVLLLFVYAVVVTLLIYWLGEHWITTAPFLRAATQVLLLVLAFVPVLFVLDREVGLWREIAPVLTGVRARVRAVVPRWIG